MITKQLAEQIVEQTMVRLHRNINVMDTNGVILASGDTNRIENFHEGAAYVSKTQQSLRITVDNIADFPGTKYGINFPVFFQHQIVGVIGITGDPSELEEFATLVQLTTEMIVHQAMITSQVEWKRKLKELTFEELIEIQPLSQIVKSRLHRIGFIAEGPLTISLIEVKDSIQSPHRLIERLEELFLEENTLIGHNGINELFIVTSKMTAPDLKKKLHSIPPLMPSTLKIQIGIGKTVESIEQIKLSFQTAKSALTLGNSKQTIIDYEEIELQALLKKQATLETKQFSERILHGLNPKLLSTLSTYFLCNQNQLECAEQLDIHRHTLSYRLTKIHEITGHNPSLFQDALVLQLAMFLD